MNDGEFHVRVPKFVGSILATVLAALLITSLYQLFEMHDTVQSNRNLAQSNAAAIELARADRGALRDRVNTLETRVAIINDRMDRRNKHDAVWTAPSRPETPHSYLAWFPAMHDSWHWARPRGL